VRYAVEIEWIKTMRGQGADLLNNLRNPNSATTGRAKFDFNAYLDRLHTEELRKTTQKSHAQLQGEMNVLRLQETLLITKIQCDAGIPADGKMTLSEALDALRRYVQALEGKVRAKEAELLDYEIAS